MSQKPIQKPPSSTREALLQKIEDYLARNPGMSAEGFGWATIKDTRLVGRLRDDGDISTRKLDAILLYFETHPY